MYKSKLFLVLVAPFYSRFQGGTLMYLDLWEDSTIRLKNLSPEEVHFALKQASQSRGSVLAINLIISCPSSLGLIISFKELYILSKNNLIFS